LHQSFFCLSLASDKILILRFPPPRTCLSLFIFFHFSIFSSPLTLPDLLQPAFFTCLFFVSLCGFSLFAAVRVSRTERESVRFRPPLSSTAPYPNAKTQQVSSVSSQAQIRSGSDRGVRVLQPLFLPPVPVVISDEPHGPFRLRAVVITDPSLRPLLQTHVVIKQTTCCSCCH
jgi:hypothetical protein